MSNIQLGKYMIIHQSREFRSSLVIKYHLTHSLLDNNTKILEKPLIVARQAITKGILDLKHKTGRVHKIWRIRTGKDDWWHTTLPKLTIDTILKLQNIVYVILDVKTINILYVGHTTQRMEKRISDHIRNALYLQKYKGQETGGHKSLIAYRIAVHGTKNIRVLP